MFSQRSFPVALCLCMAALFSACDDRPDSDNYEFVTMNSGLRIKCYKDSLLTFSSERFLVPIPPAEVANNPKDTIKGVVSTENEDKWWRTTFNFPVEQYGLHSGTPYYVQTVRCYQFLPLRSNEHLYQLTPLRSHIGFYSISQTDSRLGIRPVTYKNYEGKVHYYTRLLYIGYDAAGNKVGRYYPCPPDSLYWLYTTEKIDFGDITF